MDKTKKFNLKTILTLIAALTLSLSMILFAGCDKGSDTSSSSSSSTATEETTVKDYQYLTNGDFEFGTTKTEDKNFPVATGISWSRANDSLSTSAPTSDYKSGVIDTEEEAYKVIAKDQAFPIESGEGDSAVYFNPRTPYYYGLVKDSYVYSEETANDDKLPTTGSKVLMIHNEIKNNPGRGTAQLFTSSKTIELNADSYNLVSVWVLTKNLKTAQDTTEFGAYVSLLNTVSTSKNPFVVKNINTNGTWAQVNILVEASSLTSSSYRLVLGLGNGSRKVQGEFVEGFAYFDNAQVKTLTKAEFETEKAKISTDNSYSLYTADTANVGLYTETAKNGLEANASKVSYLPNGDKKDSYDSTKTFTTLNYSLTYNIPAVKASAMYLDSKANDVYAKPGATIGADAEIGEGAFSSIASKVTGVKNPVSDDAETLYMIFPSVASYTANTKQLTLKDGEAMLLTFYAKVKVGNAQTGLTVNVVDNGTTTTAINEKTAIATGINTNKYENENTNDWAKFFVFISNDMGDGLDRNFSLSFDFGPTSTVTDYFTLPSGYALFTGFETTMLSEKQISVASSSSNYTGTVELGKDLVNGGKDDESKDSYSFKTSVTDNVKIKTDLTNSTIGLTGVVGGHTMVGGTNQAYSQDATKTGLFNTQYIDNYASLTADEKTALKSLKAEDGNDYVQALLIKNDQATSYGYLGSSSTISANSTSTIAVKLRVFGNAKAYVYLTNANPLEGFDVLGLSAKKWSFDETNGVTYSDTETLIDKEYVQTVTATECADDYITVYFQIVSGIDPINFRVEVWNGSRNGEEKSTGMVVVESINTATNLSMSQVYANNEGGEKKEVSYKRAPTLVSYTTEDGGESTKYTQYNEEVVWTEYTKAKVIVATHATVNAETTADETVTDDGETEDTTTNTESGKVAWLEIASILIAVILILVLIIIVIRMFVKKTTKREEVIQTYYSRSSRDVANQKIAENKRRRAMEEKAKAEAEAMQGEEKASEPAETNDQAESEEALPEYDYENMENNIPVEENVQNEETSAEENTDSKPVDGNN